MHIYVDMPSGRKLTLQPKVADTIENIKAMIQDKEGIPPDHQRLMFDGEQLVNSSTISSCNIKNESTLVLERE